MAIHKKIETTDKKIKAAFIYLVNEKGLNRVTVKDITDAAHINRSTFYKHFVDKPDLVNHYEQQFLEHVTQSLSVDHLQQNFDKQSRQERQLRLYSAINQIIEYVYDDLELAKALIGPNGDPYFEEKIKAMLDNILNSDLDFIKGNHELTNYIPDDYAHEIIVSELLNIIKLWLSKANPEPPQKISEIIIRTRYLSPHDLLGVNDFDFKAIEHEVHKQLMKVTSQNFKNKKS